MEWTNIAVSYIRFSAKIQERGDSVRRQTKNAQDLCDRNDLILDNSFSFQDLGTSGFSGANLKEESGLGAFLALLKAGKIPKGITLVLEKFDRLSRQHPMRQLPLIDSILRAGIRIATTQPDRFYTEKDIEDNPYILYEILSHAMSGYGESKRKSERCGDAWTQKRVMATKGKALTKRVPAWLYVEGEKTDDIRTIKADPIKVEVLRRIFAMAEAGLGSPNICKKLNSEGVKSFTGNDWKFVYVTRLLSDRKVLGEHQPYHDKAQKQPIGEPMIGYYPTVIDQDTFDRVQVAKQGRLKNKGAKGRLEAGCVNVFRGLLNDARTGSPIGLFTYIDRRRGRCVKASRLIVRKGLDTASGYEMSFRYEVFEASFFAFVQELDPSDFSTTKAADSERLATASSALTLIGEKLEITRAKMKGKEGKVFSLLQDMVLDLEAEKSVAKQSYDTLRARLASPAVECVADSQTLIGMLATSEDPDALRLKIRTRLRQLISRGVILMWDVGIECRRALCQVVFPDGTSRFFTTGYSLSRKPYKALYLVSDRDQHYTDHYPDLSALPALETAERDRVINQTIAKREQLLTLVSNGNLPTKYQDD